jgi:drug/metabolite transporter (DMT)-like permease
VPSFLSEFNMKRFGPLFIIIAASLWAVDGIALRPMLYSLPVALVVFIESLIVAIFLTPFVLKKLPALKILTYKDWFAFFGVALFGGAIGTMAITKALFYVNFVNLSVVILIQKLQPVFALTLAALMLKERLPRMFFLWSGLAIVGAYFMTFGLTIPNLDTGEKTTVAALFSFVAAISFGSSTVFSKRALMNVSFGIGTYLRFGFASAIMLIITLTTGTLKSLTDISTTQILTFLLIAFTTGGTAIFLYYYGLKRIKASVAAICELAFPFTAIILEYIIRKNFLDPAQWTGAAVLLFSIIQGSRLNSNRSEDTPVK